MDEKYKALWVKALRSGEYKQGCGKLKTEITDKFATNKVVETYHCCLGVLGEIINNENELMQVSLEAGWLTVETVNSLGISWEQQATLSSMNDGLNNDYRKTFNEIADYIEKEL